jgi:hypothetical protein
LVVGLGVLVRVDLAVDVELDPPLVDAPVGLAVPRILPPGAENFLARYPRAGVV